MTDETFYPIVVRTDGSQFNNDFYKYLGDGKFRNLRTGGEGVVPDEVAARTFKVDLDASQLCHDYPLLERLVAIGFKNCK